MRKPQNVFYIFQFQEDGSPGILSSAALLIRYSTILYCNEHNQMLQQKRLVSKFRFDPAEQKGSGRKHNNATKRAAFLHALELAAVAVSPVDSAVQLPVNLDYEEGPWGGIC